MAEALKDLVDPIGDLLYIAAEFDGTSWSKADQLRDITRQVARMVDETERLAVANLVLRNAVQAAILFHSSSPWTPEKRDGWSKLTGRGEATTKALCDTLREAMESTTTTETA